MNRTVCTRRRDYAYNRTNSPQDRIIALYTGRLPSFPEEIIEIPLPTDEDFFPDTARSNEPAARNEPVEPVPFNYLVRLMVICGRIATVLNGRRGRPRTLMQQSEPPNTLNQLQKELVQFYADLPESLKWGVDTFKHQEARGHGVSRLLRSQTLVDGASEKGGSARKGRMYCRPSPASFLYHLNRPEADLCTMVPLSVLPSFRRQVRVQCLVYPHVYRQRRLGRGTRRQDNELPHAFLVDDAISPCPAAAPSAVLSRATPDRYE